MYFNVDDSLVLFTSPGNCALCDAKQIFGDGTFSYCPKLFT